MVVGQNRFTETEVSPLTDDAEGGILVVDPAVEAEQIAAVRRWRAERDQQAVDAALAELARIAASEQGHENLMVPTIAAARAGATTGEWAHTLREVFGSYRAPTGVGEAAPRRPTRSCRSCARRSPSSAEKLGRRPKILVGKPGLDGHSNGAEQIAVRARDAGMDVVYEGIRLTPAQIAASALQEGVHVIGLSILSGSHRELIPAVIDALRDADVNVPVVVGGIIPEQDVAPLKQAGVAAVYTPKDFDISRIVHDIVGIVGAEANARRPPPTAPRERRHVHWTGRPPSLRRERRPSARRLDRRRARQAPARARPERSAGLSQLAGEHRAGGPRASDRSAARSLPRRPRRRGPRTYRRRDRSPGRRQVDVALGVVAHLARERQERRDAGGGPELQALRRLAARRPRSHRLRSSRQSVLIRSTAAGERLGGLAPATRVAAQALAAAFDVVVIETVGVGQAETEVADLADTVVVVVQPGSGDVLQFLKSGIMETPDVLVVTKADLGQIALATRRDLSAALRSLG